MNFMKKIALFILFISFFSCQKSSTNGSLYKAYDRACPHISPNNCSTMTVENSIKMICPCDGSAFNILNGAPLTSGISFSAREYKVTMVSNTVLKITNIFVKIFSHNFGYA